MKVLIKQFVKAAGLTGKKKVMLQFPPRLRLWKVTLKKRPAPHCTLDLARGWSAFRTGNGLSVGGKYLFEFDAKKNIILVKENNV